MFVPQMGQRCEVAGVGGGTVRMGSRVADDMGGSIRFALSADDEFGRFDPEFESLSSAFDAGFVFGRRFGSTGGGSSMFSAAFRDSCRAKSDACHHSRNLRANIEVGSSILRDDSKRGYTLLAMFLGVNIDPPSPGLADPTPGFGCVASSIAL